MINYIEGNLLKSSASALVNAVNTIGVMGKGIALQFKKAFPENFNLYEKACKAGNVKIGKMFLTKENEKIIINFPTKTDWRKPSEYSYIEQGLDDLIKVILENNISSIAIPAIGAGNGGLNWECVKSMIEKKLSFLDAQIYIFSPKNLY